MAEVFTISGSNGVGVFGQAPSCPVGWQLTPNRNCGAPVAGCPPSMKFGTKACRSPAAIQLQNVLRALGRTVKDTSLANLAIDGFIGPATVKATNRALTVHVGAGQAAARLRTGKLTMSQVANEASLIAGVVGAETRRRGGTVPAPAVTKPAAKSAAKPAVKPPVPEAEGAPSAAGLWGVVALSAVAAGTGFYMAASSPAPTRPTSAASTERFRVVRFRVHPARARRAA